MCDVIGMGAICELLYELGCVIYFCKISHLKIMKFDLNLRLESMIRNESLLLPEPPCWALSSDFFPDILSVSSTNPQYAPYWF
jgi:hypothetical protein